MLSTSSGHTSSTDIVSLDISLPRMENHSSTSWWLASVRNSNSLNTSLQCTMHLQMAWQKLSIRHYTTYWRRWGQNPSETGTKDMQKRFGLIELLTRCQCSQPLTPSLWCKSCLTSGNSDSITSCRHTRRLKQGRQSQTSSSRVGFPWREKAASTTKVGVLSTALITSIQQKGSPSLIPG